MRQKIPFQRAIQVTLLLTSLVLIFHLAIILGIILFDFAPVGFLWGGRMQTAEQLLNFELLSAAVLVVFILLILIRSKKIKLSPLVGVSRIGIGLFGLLFLLNTLGNLLAQTAFEMSFAVVTLGFAILCLRVVLEPIANDR